MALSESIVIHTSAADVFAIYAEVSRWPDWDPDLHAAAIDGPFAVGSRGWIKPRSAPRLKTLITQLKRDHSFTAEAPLPGCRIIFTHTIVPVSDAAPSQVQVTHGVQFTGLLSAIFQRLVGRQIAHALPIALAGLKRHAETRRHTADSALSAASP